MKAKNNKNRNIFVALAILLIFALASSYFFFFNSRPVEAAWWNDSWQYRKSIPATNSAVDAGVKLPIAF